MSEFKGTPGPWVVENSGVFLEIREENGHGQIADTYSSGHHFDDGRCVKGIITVANSNLIAAAPELLEALQAVVRIADRDTDEFNMARAAIAKALGQ